MAACADLPETTPPDRWDANMHYSPPGAKTGIYARFGAYCAGLQDWDALYYKLPANEALAMDPHTRVLLDLSQVLFFFSQQLSAEHQLLPVPVQVPLSCSTIFPALLAYHRRPSWMLGT